MAPDPPSPRRVDGGLPPVEPDLAPFRSIGVSECIVDGQLVLATEESGQPVALDPVSAVIWGAIDGRTTVGELAADLDAALPDEPGGSLSKVSWLVASLAVHGYADWPGCDQALIPRRVRPTLTPESCVGRTIGLGGGTLLQFSKPGGGGFRVGSNHPPLLEDLEGLAGRCEIDDQDLDTFFLRASVSPSGRPRAQYLYDQLGNRLFVGGRLDAAATILRRTVEGMRSGADGVWIEGLALEGSRGAVLIHPSIREAAIDATRPLVRTHDSLFLESVLFRLVAPDEIELPPPHARRVPLAAAVGPEVEGSVARYRQLAHVLHRWDGAHLEALRGVLPSLRYIGVPNEITLEEIRRLLVAELDA